MRAFEPSRTGLRHAGVDLKKAGADSSLYLPSYGAAGEVTRRMFRANYRTDPPSLFEAGIARAGTSIGPSSASSLEESMPCRACDRCNIACYGLGSDALGRCTSSHQRGKECIYTKRRNEEATVSHLVYRKFSMNPRSDVAQNQYTSDGPSGTTE